MTSPLIRRRRAAWADELDFVGPRVRTSVWAWILLLAGATTAAWVLPQVNQADADLSQAQHDLKRMQRAERQQVLAEQAPRVARDTNTPQAPVLTPESARQAAQLAQWLAYPWMQVISQVEDAAQAESAVMLSFSLDISTLASKGVVRPDVRLAAAVRDDASALRWAQSHGAGAQLLSREHLGASFATAAGAYEWRAEASWPGGAP